MLALNKITRAKISACNVIPRLIFPGEISRDYSKKIDVDLPTKPKKPAPAFFQYLKESKSSLEREFPSHKWQDVVKIASERWRNSSPDFKKPYEETFFKNRVNHFYELNSYENKLTEEQKALIEQQKDEVSKKRAKTKLKKGMNELGKPKGPPGSYALFFAAKKGQRNAGESVTQYSSRVASDWKNLPEIEKQTYINQAKALRLQFEKDMDVWRRKALQVQSEDPLVKNAQEKLKLQEERRKEKLANIESPPEPLATENTESAFCINGKASESQSVVTAKTCEPDPLLTESEETVSVQTKLVQPSSRNSTITKFLSFISSFYQRLIESASRLTSWDFSKLRTGQGRKP